MTECKRIIINIDKMDEFNNIYPCKRIDCYKYHKSIDSHALIDALYFLKFDRVIDILNNMKYDDIISFRTYDKKHNLLEYIFTEFKGKNTRMPTMGRLSLLSNHNSILTCNLSLELTSNIINYIMNKYPELITDKVINYLNKYSGLIILNKLNSTS